MSFNRKRQKRGGDDTGTSTGSEPENYETSPDSEVEKPRLVEWCEAEVEGETPEHDADFLAIQSTPRFETEESRYSRAAYYADECNDRGEFCQSSFFPKRPLVKMIQDAIFDPQTAKSIVSIGAGDCLLEWLLSDDMRCSGINCCDVDVADSKYQYIDDCEKLTFLQVPLKTAGKEISITPDIAASLRSADILLWCHPMCEEWRQHMDTFVVQGQRKTVVLVSPLTSEPGVTMTTPNNKQLGSYAGVVGLYDLTIHAAAQLAHVHGLDTPVYIFIYQT